MDHKSFLPFMAAVFALMISLSGCSLPFSSHKEAPPPTVSDDPGLRTGTQNVITKIKNKQFLAAQANQECVICFLGVRNLRGEDIPELSSAVRRQFQQATAYRLLTDETIEAGLKKSDVKRNDIFIPAEREKLTAALETPFQYILSGRVVRSENQKISGGPQVETVVFELYSVSENSSSSVQNELAACYIKEKNKKFLGLF